VSRRPEGRSRNHIEPFRACLIKTVVLQPGVVMFKIVLSNSLALMAAGFLNGSACSHLGMAS
jgi:hypothetical protein